MSPQLSPPSIPATVGTSVPSTSDDTDAVAEGRCAMCPHPLAAHDRISLRFCAATAAAAMTRTCLCPAA